MLTNYDENFEKALAGLRTGDATGGRVLPYVAGLDSIPRYWEITIPATPADDTAYSLELDGKLATYTTGASETQEQLRDGLIYQLRINPGIMSYVTLEYDATTITLTMSRYFYSDRLMTLVGTNLTVAETAATTAPPIEFGRFVTRAAAETNIRAVKLPSSLTEVVLGCTLLNFAKEATGIGLGRQTYYRDKQTVDVVERTDNAGIYVQSLEDLDINSNVHISIAPGSEGKITPSATGTIDISNVSRVLKPTYNSHTDGKITLISFNRP